MNRRETLAAPHDPGGHHDRPDHHHRRRPLVRSAAVSAQILGAVLVATCFCLGMLLGLSLETRRRRTDDRRRGQARREMAEERAWLAEERAALLYQRAAVARRVDGD